MLLVLIGAPAAGKSRIGKKLARTLGVPFVDTDTEIVRQHGPISDLFATHGEAHFRTLERVAVEHALTGTGVVAFGGGAVLDPRTQSDIASLPVVLLTVDPSAVAGRLANGKRPLISSIESWQALVDSRRELYESLADFSIDTSHRPTEVIATEIAQWARARRPQKDTL
ncbi:shikimate kinase [Agreia bicolorata]|uniref:Shikimate kinase n=1 Tax=Agreia bicolorata TaxID=110935 RepID=A0A1T4X5X5_9MICO|nr:shikimate kinase [Agreia bicolorata]KJC65364.1 shikimate kinase [Agreia bicolorata]SKA85033.1 shikimate kinase [Agreia bicolorata]